MMFAIALINASIIGASAVSLSTAYAISDVLSLKHSLHRKPSDAKGFYAVYCGLIVVAAGLVLTPGAPLGLLTNAVQALAGVLLPSATVFLLLLCNDKRSVRHRATIGACRRCTNCPPAICRSRRGRGCLFCAPISSSLAGSSWCGSRRWPSATTEKTEGPRAPLGSCGEHPTWERAHAFNAATNLSWPNEICRHRTKQTHHEGH
jgi:hypothetical protein